MPYHGRVPVRAWLALSLAGLSGCALAEPAPPLECASRQVLRFVPDVPRGAEAYLCFAFDRTGDDALRAVGWSPPAHGGVALHHATLYALEGSFPAGPVPCDAMPTGAIGLGVWAPGERDFALPDGYGVVLGSARRLVVQAHVLGVGDAPAGDATASLCFAGPAPSHPAASIPARAPVPAIRPHSVETSTATCRLSGAVRLVGTWPHMHSHGLSFAGALVRGSGEKVPLVDVPMWDVGQQTIHALDVAAAAGDRIETSCTWQNDSDGYILPGPRTSDEMCAQSLTGSPPVACAP